MSEWISVKDRLPPLKLNTQNGIFERPSECVLVFTEDGNIYVGTYSVYTTWGCYSSGCGCCEYPLKVTHWMPLPPPPEIKDE